jgi:ABC-2 type transport system permease protein
VEAHGRPWKAKKPYRGADFSIVWPQILTMAVIGAVYFAFAHHRFRRVIFGG